MHILTHITVKPSITICPVLYGKEHYTVTTYPRFLHLLSNTIKGLHFQEFKTILHPFITKKYKISSCF